MTTQLRGASLVTAILLTMGLCHPSQAAEGLSLEQAIATALGENIAVAAAKTEVSVAEQAIRTARAQSYPTLSAVGSYGTYSGDVLFTRFIPGLSGGGEGTDVGEFDKNRLAVLEIAQPLYVGGANSAQREIRRIEAEIAEESLRGDRLDTIYAVTEAYYGLLLGQKKVEVASQSLRRSEASFSLIDSRFNEQEALKAELLGAKSQLAADQLSLKHAQNEVLLAQGKLNLLLSRDLSTPIDPSGELITVARSFPPPGNASQVIRSTPSVRTAHLQQQLGDAAIARSRALGKPKLELRGSYAWIDNDLLFKGDYVAATLNLSIPFARDLTAGSAAKHQARAQRDLAVRSAVHAEREVQVVIEYSYRQFEEATAMVDVAKSYLDFHQEKHRVQESAFREELVTFSDLLDEHVDLAEAELGYFKALHDARLAEAHLKRVVAQE
ncbi:MAG: TolC family protein [bacterium]|nr:TolC family protein [bacterium]